MSLRRPGTRLNTPNCLRKLGGCHRDCKSREIAVFQRKVVNLLEYTDISDISVSGPAEFRPTADRTGKPGKSVNWLKQLK